MTKKAKMDVFYYNAIPDVNIPCELLFEEPGVPKNISYVDDDGTRQIYSLEYREGDVLNFKQRGGDGSAVMCLKDDEIFGTWFEAGYHGMWKIRWE